MFGIIYLVVVVIGEFDDFIANGVELGAAAPEHVGGANPTLLDAGRGALAEDVITNPDHHSTGLPRRYVFARIWR